MKITSQQLRRMILETAVDLEARLDIVDGDTGEIYALAHDEDGWNDAPYSGLAADFEIWLADNSEWFGGRHVEYIKHPDAEALSQAHGNRAWYVRHAESGGEALDYRTEDLVGQYNLPKGGWGIPEPDRGTTREGTDKMKITESKLRQIIREELSLITEFKLHPRDQYKLDIRNALDKEYGKYSDAWRESYFTYKVKDQTTADKVEEIIKNIKWTDTGEVDEERMPRIIDYKMGGRPNTVFVEPGRWWLKMTGESQREWEADH